MQKDFRSCIVIKLYTKSTKDLDHTANLEQNQKDLQKIYNKLKTIKQKAKKSDAQLLLNILQFKKHLK